MNEDAGRIVVPSRSISSAEKVTQKKEIIAPSNFLAGTQSDEKLAAQFSSKTMPVHSDPSSSESLSLDQPVDKKQNESMCPKLDDPGYQLSVQADSCKAIEESLVEKTAKNHEEEWLYNVCKSNEKVGNDEICHETFQDIQRNAKKYSHPDYLVGRENRNISSYSQDISPVQDYPFEYEYEAYPIVPFPKTPSHMTDSQETRARSRESSPRASMDEALKSEKAFIDYVMSLPCSPTPPVPEHQRNDSRLKCKSKVPSPAPSGKTKVGLDHLDNLCKLMEQLSELRETNTKLQKRVQYLEDVRTLHEMHKEIRCDAQYGSENFLTARRQAGLKKSRTGPDPIKKFPRGSEDFVDVTLTPAPVSHLSCKEPKSSHKSRLAANPAYDGRRRERSKSVGHDEAFYGKPRRIFPKWSKVKEALGWDRSVNVSQAKANFLEGFRNENRNESSARPREDFRISEEMHSRGGNHKVPSPSTMKTIFYPECHASDDLSHLGSLTGDVWKHSSTLHSSAEDVAGLVVSYQGSGENYKRYSEASEKRYFLLEPPTEGLIRQKSTPSPSDDRRRHCQDILDLKPKSLTIERDIDAEQAFAKFEKEDAKKPNKSPWGRVKTIIERRRDSLKRRQLRKGAEPETAYLIPRGDIEVMGYEEAPVCSDDLVFQTQNESPRRKSSDDQFSESYFFLKNFDNMEEMDKACKREKGPSSIQESELISNDQQSPSHRAPKTPYFHRSPQSHDVIRVGESEFLQMSGRSDQTCTPSSSPPFHRRSRWGRVKKVLRGRRDGEGNEMSSLSMPTSPDGITDVAFDFEDTDVMEDDGEEEHFTDDRNGADIEKVNSRNRRCCPTSREITRVGSDSFVHQISLSSSAPVSDIMQELQRNLSEDFNRKIKEWERIRGMGGYRPTSPKWERKNSNPKHRFKKQDKNKPERFEKSIKPKIKDLSWLEKELQKIEKEKQRLSKEKQKYEERAFRLERLKQTVLTAGNSHKKEVLVRTSAGEFRFEGISDAFTKKLYEWETKRGVGPELSTIALLDSSLGINNKTCLVIQSDDKGSSLNRTISKSESSLMDIGQPSHTSSNSLPSLKPPEIGDIERIHHPSRASSEPDLHSISTIVNTPNGGDNSGNAFDSRDHLPPSNVSFTNIVPDEDTSKYSLEGPSEDPRCSYTSAEVTDLMDRETEHRLRERKEVEQEIEEQREENYYSLLEENVFLLEKLKKKEEICRTLEKELELLDEKVEEMNIHHQNEMERYREKLWEMHKPGNTPRDVQGCIEIISELKTRIEELEKCSERLKNDRENIQDSFRFHSEQQEHMTLDLLNKMRELQAAGRMPSPESLPPEKETETMQNKKYLLPIFDLKILERLQDLSGQLVQQTVELEQALAERSQQICQLRWELLHRDVSTVKLETELHSAHIRGNQTPCRAKCETKRCKYAHFRSWSSEEASSRVRQQTEISSRFDRFAHRSQETYHNLAKADFQTANLTTTVNELNKELLRLSSAAETFLLTNTTDCEESPRATETEKIAEFITFGPRTVKVVEGNSPRPTEDTCIGMDVEERLNEDHNYKASRITVRRNSVGNISSVSGPDASENSSLNELEWHPSSTATYILQDQPSESDVSSSSEDLTEEECFTSVSWCSNSDSRKSTPVLEKEIVLNYPSRKSIYDKRNGLVLSQHKSNASDSKNSERKLCSRIGICKSESARGYEILNKNVSSIPKRSMSGRERNEFNWTAKDVDSKMHPKHLDSNLKTDHLRSKTPKRILNTKNSLKEKIKADGHEKRNEKGRLRAKNVRKNRNDTKTIEDSSCDVAKSDQESDLANIVVLKLSKKKNRLKSNANQVNICGKPDIISISDGKENKDVCSNVTETITVVLPRKRNTTEHSDQILESEGDKTQRQINKQLRDYAINGNQFKMSKDSAQNSFECDIIGPDNNSYAYESDTRTTGVESHKKDCMQGEKVMDSCGGVDIPNEKCPSGKLSHGYTTSHYSSTNSIINKDQSTSSKTSMNDGNEEHASIISEKVVYSNRSEQCGKSSSSYTKSPSAPQLNWNITSVRKPLNNAAPNVRALIEKYNQKCMVSAQPIPIHGHPDENFSSRKRKLSDIGRRHKNFQNECTNDLTCPGNSPLNPRIYSFQRSLELQPSPIGQLYSPPVSPPTSPASRARAEALRRAKENFISSSNVAHFKLPESAIADENQLSSLEIAQSVISDEDYNSKMESKRSSLPKDYRASRSSSPSMDSVSLVYRTGESCQESRISRKPDGTKEKSEVLQAQDKQLCTSRSFPTPSVMKLVTGHEIKLPSGILNLKLRRSKKKKDMSTVSALCRQSLFVGSDAVNSNESSYNDDVKNRKKSTRSCPSSPELKAKSKTKTSWLHRNIFKQK